MSYFPLDFFDNPSFYWLTLSFAFQGAKAGVLFHFPDGCEPLKKLPQAGNFA